MATNLVDEGEYALVAVFEFEDGPVEEIVLLRDSERRCLLLSQSIEDAQGHGQLLVYTGKRDAVPVSVALAVGRAIDLVEEPV